MPTDPPENVVDLPVVTTLDIDPARVLKRAGEKAFKGVLVIGYLENGDWFFASSYADGAEVNWHLTRAQHKLMKTTDDLERE